MPTCVGLLIVAIGAAHLSAEGLPDPKSEAGIYPSIVLQDGLVVCPARSLRVYPLQDRLAVKVVNQKLGQYLFVLVWRPSGGDRLGLGEPSGDVKRLGGLVLVHQELIIFLDVHLLQH